MQPDLFNITQIVFYILIDLFNERTIKANTSTKIIIKYVFIGVIRMNIRMLIKDIVSYMISKLNTVIFLLTAL